MFCPALTLRIQRTPVWRQPAQGLTKVHVNALVNDTVAALAAARYLDGPDAVGSVIMGTGAGAALPLQAFWQLRQRAHKRLV